MNSRKGDVFNIDVHRASYVKKLRSKKHLENENQNELNIPEWLLKRILKLKNIFNPKPSKEIARDNVNIDDKQLNKNLAKKMINPNYFKDRALKIGFNITLEKHHINMLFMN